MSDCSKHKKEVPLHWYTTIICAHCGKTAKRLIAEVNRAKNSGSPIYCNFQCASEAKKVRRLKKCARCGKDFIANRNSKKHCSSGCARSKPKVKAIQIRVCNYCKKPFTPKEQRRSKYCTQTCFFKDRFGDKNWMGSGYSYEGLHYHMRNLVPKTGVCKDCGKAGRLDLANKSQEYMLEISDWEWLCRKCHIHKDGRIKNLQQKHKEWETARTTQKTS